MIYLLVILHQIQSSEELKNFMSITKNKRNKYPALGLSIVVFVFPFLPSTQLCPSFLPLFVYFVNNFCNYNFSVNGLCHLSLSFILKSQRIYQPKKIDVNLTSRTFQRSLSLVLPLTTNQLEIVPLVVRKHFIMGRQSA